MIGIVVAIVGTWVLLTGAMLALFYAHGERERALDRKEERGEGQ